MSLRRARTALVVAALAAGAGCSFTLDRGALLEPGVVHARVVDKGGNAVPFATVSVAGTRITERASKAGEVRLRLAPGAASLRFFVDDDGDGKPELGALRGVRMRKDGERLIGIELGPVTLLGTGAASGTVENLPGGAEALVVIARSGVDVGLDGAGLLGADARGVTEGGAFELDGLIPGPAQIIAFYTDDPTNILVGGPVSITIPADGTFPVGALALVPAAVAAVDVTVATTAGDAAAAAGGTGLLRATSKGGDVTTVEAQVSAGDAGVLVGVRVGLYDVVAAFDEPVLSGALFDQIALPDNAAWGPVLLFGGDPCANATDDDRDGDGLAALPDPSIDLSPWLACASACEPTFGQSDADCDDPELGRFDCDDDGDLQPDVTEPYGCVALCAGADVDADGTCDAIDPDPSCGLRLDLDATVCVGDPDYTPPPVLALYRTPPGPECAIDSDCPAGALGAIALCDVVAGGVCVDSGVLAPTATTTYFHDTTGWGAVTIGASPSPRRGHTFVFTPGAPAGIDALMFGGLSPSGDSNELWSWDGGALAVPAPPWGFLFAIGDVPTPRHGAAAIYDGAGGRLFIVGGAHTRVDDGVVSEEVLQDVYVLDIAALSFTRLADLPVPMPPPIDVAVEATAGTLLWSPTAGTLLRFDAAAPSFSAVNATGVPPPTTARLRQAGASAYAIVGAHTNDSFERAGAFLLSCTTTTDCLWLDPQAGTETLPSAFTEAAVATDGLVVRIFGGRRGPAGLASASTNELWRFDGAAWSRDLGAELDADVPPPRTDAEMVFDGTRFVVFGGDEHPADDADNVTLLFGDTWVRAQSLPVEPRRNEAAVTFHRATRSVVVFGGLSADNGTVLGDTWLFSFDTRTWTELVPVGGVAPSARHASAMTSDHTRNVIVLYGGDDGTGALSDLWELSVETQTWTPRIDVDTTAIGPRKLHAMAFDPQNFLGPQVEILAGTDGVTRTGASFKFDGTTVSVGPILSAVERGAATDFPDEPGLMFYGGTADGATFSNDIWDIDSTTDASSNFAVTALSGAPRAEAGLAYDHFAGRLLLFGGVDATGTAQADLFSLSPPDPVTATPVTTSFLPPAPRRRPLFISVDSGMFLCCGGP